MNPTTKKEILKFISASSIAFAIMSIGYLLFFVFSGNKEVGFWSVIYFAIGLVLFLVVMIADDKETNLDKYKGEK